MFQAALFDLDGTLFKTEHQYSIFWGMIGKKYHPDLPDFPNVIKGMTLNVIYDMFFQDYKEQLLITQKLDEWEKNMDYEYVEGAYDFIRDIKSYGVKCAIVTSSNSKKILALKQKVKDVDELFDNVFTSEMFLRSKPFPDPYLTAAKHLNVSTGQCVVFEDAYNGLKSAKNANMFTIGLTTTFEYNLIKDLCDYSIDNYIGLNYHVIEKLLINH